MQDGSVSGAGFGSGSGAGFGSEIDIEQKMGKKEKK
jgi:hypothetical protein